MWPDPGSCENTKTENNSGGDSGAIVLCPSCGHCWNECTVTLREQQKNELPEQESPKRDSPFRPRKSYDVADDTADSKYHGITSSILHDSNTKIDDNNNNNESESRSGSRHNSNANNYNNDGNDNNNDNNTNDTYDNVYDNEYINNSCSDDSTNSGNIPNNNESRAPFGSTSATRPYWLTQRHQPEAPFPQQEQQQDTQITQFTARKPRPPSPSVRKGVEQPPPQQQQQHKQREGFAPLQRATTERQAYVTSRGTESSSVYGGSNENSGNSMTRSDSVGTAGPSVSGGVRRIGITKSATERQQPRQLPHNKLQWPPGGQSY